VFLLSLSHDYKKPKRSYSKHAFVIFLIPFADAAFTFSLAFSVSFFLLPFCSPEQYHNLSASGQKQKVHFNYILKAPACSKTKASGENPEKSDKNPSTENRCRRWEKKLEENLLLFPLHRLQMIFLRQSNN
jgi:hypothetical protein